MGFLVTWQELWMLAIVGSVRVLGWSVLGLGEGKGGSFQAISVSIDTYMYTLVDQHSYKAHQVACSLVT